MSWQWVLLPALLLSIAPVTISVTITIDNLSDYDGLSANCNPSNGTCNLRSAWALCNEQPGVACTINLRSRGLHDINTTLGHLELQPDADIYLAGSASTLASTINEGPFPFEMTVFGRSNKALDVYDTGCITACPLDTLIFSACNNIDTTRDTFFRLFQGATQVALSDDLCGRGSHLRYTVPASASCQEYCLHMGCFSAQDISCATTVTLSHTRYASPANNSRLIYYSNTTTASASALKLGSVFIQSFGGPHVDGGVMYLNGPVKLTLDTVIFPGSVGAAGGALYVANNSQPVVVIRCNFTPAQARIGGAIYIGGNVTAAALTSNAFQSATARESGGAVFVDVGVSRLTFLSNSFTLCSAARAGGGIFVSADTKQIAVMNSRFTRCTAGTGGAVAFGRGNQEFIVSGCTFTDCSTTSADGGAVHIDRGNRHGVVRNSVLIRCRADGLGGGVMIGQENDAGIALENLQMTNCSALNGGGVYVDSNNHGVTIADTRVTNCRATSNGGGVYFGRRNQDATLRNSTITACRADTGKGGGVYVNTQNSNFTLDRSRIAGCAAVDGGGLCSMSNDGLAVRDSTISRCNAQESGGGIGLVGANVDILLKGSDISRNTAGISGGGVFSGRDNQGLTFVSTSVTHNRASGNGGGIYVESGNPHLSLLDAQTYEGMQVIESAHPYSYAPPRTYSVSVVGAEAYFLYFSQDTRMADHDQMWFTEDGLTTELPQGSLPGIDMPALRTTTASFAIRLTCANATAADRTSLEDGYFGYRLYVLPIFPTPQSPTIVSDNGAGTDGAGMYMFGSVAFPAIMHARFLWNTADASGGAIYLRNSVVGMITYGGVFEYNKAKQGDGGAVAVVSTCQGMRFERCSFYSNEAWFNGGGIAFGTGNGKDGELGDNENSVSFCSFYLGRAFKNGAGVYLGQNNVLRVTDTTFRKGSGDLGGGIMLSESNTLNLYHSVLDDHWAGTAGGGLAALAGNMIRLQEVIISANRASRWGGGVYLNGISSVIISAAEGPTRIISNQVFKAGGGICSFNGAIPTVTGGYIDIVGNTAPRGSGMYLNSVVDPTYAYTEVRGYSFSSNIAEAGTVYWVAGNMFDQMGLEGPFVLYENNTVSYGGDVTTQGVHVIAPQGVVVQDYEAAISPALRLTMTDNYDTHIEADEFTFVTMGLKDPSIDQCNGRFPYLAGADVSAPAGVDFQGGVAVLGSTVASCSPGGTITIALTAYMSGFEDITSEDSLYAYGTMKLSFRHCVAGEIIVSGRCVTCPENSYSLSADVTDATVCTECLSLSSVDGCVGNQIVLSDGFWRRYPTSETILPCLDELSGCAGGDQAGDASCLIGYEGPLCSHCSEGYYRSDKKCILCVEKGHFSPAAVFFASVGGAGLIVGVSFLLYKAQHSGEAGLAALFLVVAMNIAMWFKKEIRDLKVQLKILITTFQICSAIPVAMTVVFPPQFSRYLSAMTVFNLNVMSAVPVDCNNSGGYNFIDKLVMLTLAPIGLSLLLLVACVVEYTYRHISFMRADVSVRTETATLDAHEKKMASVVSRYLTLFFLLTYLVLPFIATTLFRTFLCTDLDPNNEDADSEDLFLTADMRISCTSDYYKRGVAYASVMIVVYVMGIPTMYLTLLYLSRKEIMERFDTPPPATHTLTAASSKVDIAATGSERVESGGVIESAVPDAGAAENRKEPADVESTSAKVDDGPVNQLKARHDHAARNALMISFLYEAYEPKYWYWEVVETTRRLMLTAVLSVCGPGTSAQALLAVLLALMYIKLYGYYAPYLKDSDDLVAETGQFQIFLSFLGALVYQRHLLGEEWNNTVGVALILINTAVFVLFMYFASITLYRTVKAVGGKQAPRGDGDVLVKPAAVVTPSGNDAVASRSSRNSAKVYAVTESDNQDPTGGPGSPSTTRGERAGSASR